MAHDVFVSYSSKDKTVADAVTAKLESLGIRCWIAPRDILPGRDWGEAIVEGIEECKVMVLVFSQNANESVQIKREVERAVNKAHPVIPFRIEDVQPAKSLEYFISSQHWLDALTPNMEEHLKYLGETVNLLLARSSSDEQPRSRPFPKTSSAAPAAVKLTAKQLGAAAVFLLLAFFGYRLFNRQNPDLDSIFEGDWHQDNDAAGFHMDISINDDGRYHSKIKIEENGDFSYDSALKLNGFGGQRYSGWEFAGPTSVKAMGLIPNNIWGFISFAIPQAAQGNQVYKLATEAIFTHISGPGQAPRFQGNQADVYEYDASVGGIPWKFRAEFGPGSKYHFDGSMEDDGKFQGKEGRWTFVSDSGNVTNGTYQAIDKNTLSLSSIAGPGVWKRKK